MPGSGLGVAHSLGRLAGTALPCVVVICRSQVSSAITSAAQASGVGGGDKDKGKDNKDADSSLVFSQPQANTIVVTPRLLGLLPFDLGHLRLRLETPLGPVRALMVAVTPHGPAQSLPVDRCVRVVRIPADTVRLSGV